MLEKILKNLKFLVMCLCFCLLIAPTNTFASTVIESNLNEESEVIMRISGINFNYKNAPELARYEHELNCEYIGISPADDDVIFIPVEGFERYGISQEMRSGYDDYVISSSGDMIYIKNVLGSGSSYSVNKSTLVGYNHVNKGEAVRCLQIFLNRFNNNLGLAVDGIFGSNTHTQLIRFQSFANLSTDAICGRNTWNAFLQRYSGA